jgi:hypothetical protein
VQLSSIATKGRRLPFRWIIRGATKVAFDTVLIVIACLVGAVLVGAVVLLFLGFSDWMNRGSH